LDIITQLIGLSITINLLLQQEVTTAEFLNIKRELDIRTVLLTKLILQTRADDPARIPLEKYAAYAAAICLAEFIVYDQNSKTDFVDATTIQNYDRGFPTEVKSLIVQNIRTINLLIGNIGKDVGHTERVTLAHSRTTNIALHEDFPPPVNELIGFFQSISGNPSGFGINTGISTILDPTPPKSHARPSVQVSKFKISTIVHGFRWGQRPCIQTLLLAR
jgi:hypothetical protein